VFYHINLHLENINRILVIKLRAIGDVFAIDTGCSKFGNDHFPLAQIDFLTDKFAAEVVIGNPGCQMSSRSTRKNDSSVGMIRQVREKNMISSSTFFPIPGPAIHYKIKRRSIPCRDSRFDGGSTHTTSLFAPCRATFTTSTSIWMPYAGLTFLCFISNHISA